MSLLEPNINMAQAAPPRSMGALQLVSKCTGARSTIGDFRSSGSLKALFPVNPHALEAILINTSGGLTGGDTQDIAATARQGSQLTLTTQAAERAYRADTGQARVTARISVETGARLNWLPQELILYDGASLDRRLRINLAANAQLLMVEPVIFGRAAMGERLEQIRFRDHISIRRNNAPLYTDTISLSGPLRQYTGRGALMPTAGAMASLLYVAPDAEAHLNAVRSLMPDLGGATLLQPDVLALRLLAPDSFELRRSLLPVLDRLSGDTLPRSWRL